MKTSATICADDFFSQTEVSGGKGVTPIVGKFERLPKWLNCVPLVAQWLWLSLRYGSVSLPSAANPSITSGGMVGEGKLEYFDCMKDSAKKFVAEYISILIEAETSARCIIAKMEASKLDFPVVAKPNLGWCGYGVRLISDISELKNYISVFPRGEMLMLQRYLPQAGEAGLFYARHPDEATGRVIGITLRYFPQVVGDGVHTIAELIASEPRLHRVQNNKLHEPGFKSQAVPARGEIVRLSTIGSTRVGGLYCDGSEYISPALDAAVDGIAHGMKAFYIGRFDVRYESLEQLRDGQGFTIMEVNGSGSEAIHAWDPKYSIAESYAIIFAKQRLLFEISHANRKRGHRPIGLLKLAQLHFHQQKLITRYPLSN